jgi:hypothetical protein
VYRLVYIEGLQRCSHLFPTIPTPYPQDDDTTIKRTVKLGSYYWTYASAKEKAMVAYAWVMVVVVVIGLPAMMLRLLWTWR